MAIQECGNGHLYDTDQYASCPYCQGGGNRINFGGTPGFGEPDMGMYGGVPGMGMDTGIGRTVGAGMQYQPPVSPDIPVGVPQDEIGATVPPSSYNRSRQESEDTGKTVAVFKKKMQFEPVVGWLVCVEGSEKGNDFKFYAKTNTIGRSEKNDICIKGDSTMSRDHHAKIAYDDKHNTYYIMPGDASNPVYLNEDPVYMPAALKSYDLLEMGEGKYLVITLCNKKFNWESGIDSGLDI